MTTLNEVILNAIKETVALAMPVNDSFGYILGAIAKAREKDAGLKLSDAPLDGVAKNIFPPAGDDDFVFEKFELDGSAKCLEPLEITFGSGDSWYTGAVVYGEPGTGKTTLTELIKLAMVGGTTPKKVSVEGMPKGPFKKVTLKTTWGVSTNKTPLYAKFGTAFITEDIELQSLTREALKKLTIASADKDYLDITKTLAALKTSCSKMLAGFEATERVRAKFDEAMAVKAAEKSAEAEAAETKRKHLYDVICSINACSKAAGEAGAHISTDEVGSYGVLLSAKVVSHPDWLNTVTKQIETVLQVLLGAEFDKIELHDATDREDDKDIAVDYPSLEHTLEDGDVYMVGWHYQGFIDAVVALGELLKSVSCDTSTSSGEDAVLHNLRVLDSYYDTVMNRSAWGDASDNCPVCKQQLDDSSKEKVDDAFSRTAIAKSKITKTIGEMVSLLKIVAKFLKVVADRGANAVRYSGMVIQRLDVTQDVYDDTFSMDEDSIRTRADVLVIQNVLESISDAVGRRVNNVVSSMVDIVNGILRDEFPDLPMVQRGIGLINTMMDVDEVPTYGIIICDPFGNRVQSSQISTGESAVIRALLQIAAVIAVSGKSFICIDGAFNPVPDNYVVQLVSCLVYKMKFRNVIVTTNRTWVRDTLSQKFKTLSQVNLPQ